jgi:hypothetical protein
LQLIAVLIIIVAFVTVTTAQWNDHLPLTYNGTAWSVVDLEDEYKLGRPPLPYFDPREPNRIFVGISAFKDAERCGRTVFLLFDRARDANRVDVGVVDQKNSGDLECLEVFCRLQREKLGSCRNEAQAKRVIIDASMSKGPVFARSHQRQMLGEQTFCMQLDAHSQFVDNWDDELINQVMTVMNGRCYACVDV